MSPGREAITDNEKEGKLRKDVAGFVKLCDLTRVFRYGREESEEVIKI